MAAAFGILEWSFVALVAVLSVIAGLFSLYVVLQQFRNTGRSPSRSRR